jgi:hypothetical protein
MQGQRVRARLLTLVSIAVIVPVGFWLKSYDGPGRGWVNNSSAGVAYVIFWCLVLFLAWPRRAATGPIAAAVLLATGGLEVLQLWNPAPLAWARGTFIGRTLLGTTFAWSDFVYYVIGCGLALIWMRLLARWSESGTPRS